MGRPRATGRRKISLDSPQTSSAFLAKESASPAVWDKSPYSRYYWAGQWVILLEAVCIPDRVAPDAAFWEKQKKTLDKGIALFAEDVTKEAQTLAEDFKRISSSMGELERNPSNQRSRSNLKLDLDHLVQSFASE